MYLFKNKILLIGTVLPSFMLPYGPSVQIVLDVMTNIHHMFVSVFCLRLFYDKYVEVTI
jgi:hypothetical protein